MRETAHSVIFHSVQMPWGYLARTATTLIKCRPEEVQRTGSSANLQRRSINLRLWTSCEIWLRRPNNCHTYSRQDQFTPSLKTRTCSSYLKRIGQQGDEPCHFQCLVEGQAMLMTCPRFIEFHRGAREDEKPNIIPPSLDVISGCRPHGYV